MAPRKNPKSGSPAPGARRETKHGSKNGKKEGVSGSSFFTWFMVIALLGVWTSVAVVWFELVDYEEVLGKLGIYDADGDGDFDVEDAKILLGLKERSVLEQPTPRDNEELIQQPSEQPHIRTEHRGAEPEPEDEIQSLLREALNSQLGETDEEHEHEGIPFQQEENTETPEDTVEVPVVEEDYDEELEDKMPDILAAPESFQEEPTSDHEVQEPELDEPHDMHEYATDVEENTYEPVESDARELNLEDALVHETETFSEHEEQQDYVDEHEMENEDYIETQDTDGEPVTEHYYEAVKEYNLQAEPVDSAEQRNEREVDVPETISEHSETDEGEHENNPMDGQPHETEIPIHTEGHSKDDLVDT